MGSAVQGHGAVRPVDAGGRAGRDGGHGVGDRGDAGDPQFAGDDRGVSQRSPGGGDDGGWGGQERGDGLGPERAAEEYVAGGSVGFGVGAGVQVDGGADTDAGGCGDALPGGLVAARYRCGVGVGHGGGERAGLDQPQVAGHVEDPFNVDVGQGQGGGRGFGGP